MPSWCRTCPRGHVSAGLGGGRTLVVMGRGSMINFAFAVNRRSMAFLLMAGAGAVAAPTGSSAAPASDFVSTVLIVDSSGSMSQNDPGGRRLDASNAYLTVSLPNDEVGIVDFDHAARVLSVAQPVGTARGNLEAAVSTIDADGETDIGAGLSAGCDILRGARGARRAAIFLTDGNGDYADQVACFASQGWPVFTIGLGADVDQALLAEIANRSGGRYLQLTSSTNLVCEFQRIRSQIAGLGPASCDDTATIRLGESISVTESVDALAGQVTFTATWTAGDLRITATSPSGRLVDRSAASPDVVTAVGATFETISVLDPEPGAWIVSIAAVAGPTEGLQYTFSTVQVPRVLSDARPSASVCAQVVHDATQGSRIRFQPGTFSGRVGGNIADGSTQRWVARAEAGQYTDLVLDSADDNVGVRLYAPSGWLMTDAAPGSGRPGWWGTLPESGDYTVEVYALAAVGSTYYDLRLAIDAPCVDPPGVVERLIATPTATGSGTISGTSIDTWIAGVGAGQTATVTLTSPDSSAVFEILAPDGSPLSAPGQTTWTGQAVGDVRIRVSNALAASTTYDVTVSLSSARPLRIR